jgi:ClpP class serine protease
MKFQRIIEAVYFQPWSIMDAGWWDIHRIIKPHILGAELPANVQTFLAARQKAGEIHADDNDCPDYDFFGNEIPKLQITPDGLAIIPIYGPLINHASLMDKMCGACSYQQIQNDLMIASSTPNIQRVILKVGSPGGMCNGMAETCRKILQVREAGIPIKAISDTLIGSAAYGIAASCDSISITETTTIGSVGSYCAILDSSKAYELAGLKIEVIKSGELKGAGMDGTSLSKDQRAQYQQNADYFGEQFRNIVRQGRMIDESLLQGQVFIGTEAIEKGFADLLIEDCASGYATDDDEMDF